MAPWEIWTYAFPVEGPHPCVIFSNAARLAHPDFDRVNVLLCRTLRGPLQRELRLTEIILDRADGLDWETLCRIDALHFILKSVCVSVAGAFVWSDEDSSASGCSGCFHLSFDRRAFRSSSTSRSQSVCERADVSRIATTAAADVANTFNLGDFSEVGELATRDLDGFERIWKSGLSGEAMTFIRRAKRGWLGGNWNIGRLLHFAQQWQHARGFLLAIGADGYRTFVRQDARAFGGRMIVAALGDERTETQRYHGGETNCVRGVQCREHFVEPEKGFQNQKIHAGILEQADLFGDEVFGVSKRSGSFAFEKLCA
jgi:hypothetical protein